MEARDFLLSYDPIAFRKHFKNIGRAYREQATALIEMCRLYADAAPKTYTEDDRLQNILRPADAALSAAGRADKGATSEAAEAFLRVQKVIKQFGSPPPNDAPPLYWKILHDLGTAMEAASKKDEKLMGTISKVNAAFMSPDPKGLIKKVIFVTLKSPHERYGDQSIIHQEIDKSTTTSEIIWRFSRYPEKSRFRIAFKQNPHFYLGLSDNAASYDSKFHQDPLQDFAYGRIQGQSGTIYVLLDKSCRLFLDVAEPHVPRIFSNLWKPHRTVILKDVVGNLDSEDLVPFDVGDSQDYWYRPSIVVDQSQHPVESGYSHVDSIIIQTPVRNWRDVLNLALKSQNVDLMIRDRSMPEPTSEWKRLPSDSYSRPEPTNFSTSGPSSNMLSATSIAANSPYTSLLMPEAPGIKRTQPDGSSKDLHLKVPDIPQRPPPTAPAGYSMTIPSPIPEQEPRFANSFRRKGWRKMSEVYPIWDPSDIDQKRLPSPEPRVRGQEPEDRTTPRQSATRLPQLEYSNPNSSVTSIGISTLSSPSSESFVKAADISTVTLPMREAVGDRTWIIGNGIDLQVELPTADNLRTSLPSPPPADLPPELRYSTPMFSTPTTLQSTTGASTHLPAVSLGGFAPPATSAPAQFPTSSPPSLSRSLATSGGRGSDHGSDGDGAIMLAPNWWSRSKNKRTIMIPVEQAEGYIDTRSRVIEAISGALGTAARIGHEALFTGVDLLKFAPVPGLDVAGNILLSIWDAVEMVETNRRASLRLTERCADILIAIRGEIADAGCAVAEELRAPIAKLVEAFGEVRYFLNKLSKRTFLARYLRRDEILSSISGCDTSLSDALGMFNLSIQFRTLKLIQANELRRQKETHDLLESLSHLSPSLPPAHLSSLPATLQTLPADLERVRNTLHALSAAQDAQDRTHDMADLHQLVRATLAAKDDAAMNEVFPIARSEMPEAIKTLERALEYPVEDGKLDAEDSTTALLTSQEEAGKDTSLPPDAGTTGAGHSSADTLDHEFITTGIHALRRLSQGRGLGLPSWTITWFEVDLKEKVGLGCFSDVYRGTWRKRTVAIKVLAETTPRKMFLREVNIWKSLYHPNVLELFGASSASGDPPWFLVSEYCPRGSLVKYLKGLSGADVARVDALKMMHEISKGMAYLHKRGVLHGDLKAANILVGDDERCFISDFGQSEMKSEVYRITHSSQPRGTLRWQAPEMMQGAQKLTQEMDVYAFAICCWEILTMGDLPWPLMDDIAVRHSVLNENMRPPLPPSRLLHGQLMMVICASWDRVPSDRPSFEQIACELEKQYAGRSA